LEKADSIFPNLGKMLRAAMQWLSAFNEIDVLHLWCFIF